MAFRIDPSRLSYANDRKFEARGGHGYVRKATLLPPTQIQRGSGHHESHGREPTAPKTEVAVKSLHARGDIDSERFEKVRGTRVQVRGSANSECSDLFEKPTFGPSCNTRIYSSFLASISQALMERLKRCLFVRGLITARAPSILGSAVCLRWGDYNW